MDEPSTVPSRRRFLTGLAAAATAAGTLGATTRDAGATGTRTESGAHADDARLAEALRIRDKTAALSAAAADAARIVVTLEGIPVHLPESGGVGPEGRRDAVGQGA